jgi:hypothetical protein
MQEANERTITSRLAILPSGLIRDFVASPGRVTLRLDAEGPRGGSRDEKLTPETEVDHGETVSV